MDKNILIVAVSPRGIETAQLLKREIGGKVIAYRGVTPEMLSAADSIVFIGAMGICVRMIAPLVKDKHTDPAVICLDSTGKFVIPVLSGHVGGANDLARSVASILGATPVITTQSDVSGLWALDTLGIGNNWKVEVCGADMNEVIFRFVNGKPVGLLLEITDCGTEKMRANLPENVRLIDDISQAKDLSLVIAVTPYIYETEVPVLYYRPAVLNLGVGCRKNCDPAGVATYIMETLAANRLSVKCLHRVCTIDLKAEEPLIWALKPVLHIPITEIFTAEQLKDIEVPNPSEKAHEVTGVWGVAESCAIAASGGGPLLLEKHKGAVTKGNEFTFAVAIDKAAIPGGGHIEIVGAGPGDPELVSVRGRRFLEKADLILYAGSLVPRELTECHKPGCVVCSSASMNLEEQFSLMKEFYDRGKLVVRLHTGDPCIYGAIEEQMALFDANGMNYHITPGISSFLAAAAELRSQFTIPEKVQTIILTRGEGRTPMPEKEKLSKLAQSQSTMCIYLSASIVEDVQAQLLEAYPPTTPVAACYKLTWKEQRIYRGQLKDLASIVRDNNLILTTLLVIGDAIDNREGLSKLYDRKFSHLFRK